MKRSSFFKSLVALVAAPSILADIDFARPPVAAPKTNGIILSDLKFVTPTCYKNYLEMYGNEDYAHLLEYYAKSDPKMKYLYFDSKIGEMKISDTPVSATVTINKWNY